MFKKLSKKKLLLLPLSLGLSFTNISVFAATTTSTFTVSATVVAACTVTATDLAFGNYTLSQVDATSNINVTCTNGTAYRVALSAGNASGATTTTRKMTGPVVSSVQQYLPYIIYSDSARTTNWGASTSTDVTGTGTGSQITHTTYGRIVAGQNAYLGSYSDVITVTITY